MGIGAIDHLTKESGSRRCLQRRAPSKAGAWATRDPHSFACVGVVSATELDDKATSRLISISSYIFRMVVGLRMDHQPCPAMYSSPFRPELVRRDATICS
eukprot:CAMPEP_0203839616 /NCGR_PEP_ID=MMETSP0359-20131031/286_1 /ASSEMBLY_ACC=CAM_ASM_000338 /TAXON_ID=268821 /ORGANISM="Scrippsiella Hangoei, Strain SHTV-5" /LENGTH=99 /DNA_ID=CAMNT_0050753687 /DNA_START=1 /DNA_END=297 /DNA_ORIENTATION=+